MKAFPQGNCASHEGMDLRDYFAAKAMPLIDTSNRSSLSRESKEQYVAHMAYAYADAMMKAREQ